MFKIIDDIRASSMMRLARYLPPFKWHIAGAIAAMAAGGGASSLIALILGKLTDMSFYGKDPLTVYLAPLALIGISILHGGSRYLSSYLLVRVSQSVLLEVRTMLFSRMLRWSDKTFMEHRNSELQAKFVNEASNALTRAAGVLTTMVRDSIQIVCLVAVLIWHNWMLTLVSFVVAPLLAIVIRWVNRRIKSLTRRQQLTFGELIGTVLEAYNGERVVKIYDGYEYENDRFREVNEKIRTLSLRQQRVSAAGMPLLQLITMIGVSFVVVFALMQAQSGALTIGEFTTFLAAMLLLMPPIRHLSDLSGSTATMIAAADSLFETIDEIPEEDPGTRELKECRGAVRFEDVSFTYPGKETPAVKNFTLDVKPGEMIALVGSSGSGKSTLVNLIPRFWAATEGEIYFDGIPQSELTLRSLRDQIALVSQDVVIFDDTIAGNIAYGAMRNASREEIERVVEAAALTEFVESLPDGLDTRVGAAGNELSGGQRQRISIARAFLKNAPILLLDEATSALDTESERHIQRSLDSLLVGRTAFVVAHRLSTIINADRIVAMRNGEVVEVGTHDELLAKNGLYAHLYSLQFRHPSEV